ncbi:MAG: DNA methyltransferase [Minisyncoccia bacterium]
MASEWTEIQAKASAFVAEFKDTLEEDKWAKSFWVRFFDVFGVRERTLGSFEERVKLLKKGSGKIDFFAPGRFLIEHKTAGKNLDGAFIQATDYFDALMEEDKPRYIVVSDFARFRIYDLEAGDGERTHEFELKDLTKIKNLTLFGFLRDSNALRYADEELIDVKAVRAVGKLHKALADSNYPKESLSPLLTRLVFCFFADDTGIFDPNTVRKYLSENTKKDGSDIGPALQQIFDVLDTPDGTGGKPSERQTTLHPLLAGLPYVNGGLFKGQLRSLWCTAEVRTTILECCALDWSEISPAIFGSMFQSVLDSEDGGKRRHELGAHYTSEKNILKVIKPLFLDELYERLEVSKSEQKLRELWDDVAKITLLDPACGCGNFLVIAYRELRRLELEIIKRIDGKKGVVAGVNAGAGHLGFEVDIKTVSKLSVEHMYGIEIEAFPAEIAKLSLWLVDHMMNKELGGYYGVPLVKLPLTEAPHIVHANALTTDWARVVPKEKLTHILGNPPFLGHHLQTEDQKKELEHVLYDLPSVGVLDFVTGWYAKSASFIQGTHISCAFVSTNSIAQGEQVGILWGDVLSRTPVSITFAHRTFKWTNEAKGKAAVYCVIVGFSAIETKHRKLYVYENIAGEPTEIIAKNINPYLVDAPNVLVRNKTKSLCEAPKMQYGNKPTDGGLFILSDMEKSDLLDKEPTSEKYIKKFVGAEDSINGLSRWCLWLVDAKPDELRKMPEIIKRVQLVATFRSLSKAESTREYKFDTLFRQITQPDKDYILVPRVSSENRDYIPMSFFTKDVIVSDTAQAVVGASNYHFGVLESVMHMAWMRTVCGRLKSDYRYSKDIVYNNFPWPENPSDEKKQKVEACAQAVLDARAVHTGATLADLYDPNTMPKNLLDAHKALDRAVDACYGRTFTDEPSRLEFLFKRYTELIAQEKVSSKK